MLEFKRRRTRGQDLRQLVVRLKGGLGNQLFQYSAGAVLGHEVGAEVLVDFSWFRERQKSKSLRQPEISFIYEDLQEAPDQMWLSGSNRGATPILSRLSSALRGEKKETESPFGIRTKKSYFSQGISNLTG